MKIFSLLIFILFFNLNLSAQKIIVTGKLYVPITTTQKLWLSHIIREPVYDTFEHVFEYWPKHSLSFAGMFKALIPQLYFLNYGGPSTKIFLAPGDSVNIIYEKLKKPVKVITSLGYDIVTNRLIIGGNHPFEFNFFDSLEANTGAFIGNHIRIDPSAGDWEQRYKDSVNTRNQRRINYLNYYNKKYGLRKRFMEAAMIEINAQNLDELMEAIYSKPKNEFPGNYFAAVDTAHFTWAQYKKSNTYSSMIYVYLNHYLNWQNIRGIGSGTPGGSFVNIYENTLKHIKDDSIRNFNLSFLMAQYLDKHPVGYEEYFEKYQHDCTDSIYVKEITGLYNKYLVKFYKPLPEKLISKTKLISAKGDTVFLSNLFKNKKPVVFDFWASWCGPCLMEMPQIKKFEEEYKNKIDFVYVSIDEKTNNWLSAITNNHLSGKQYLLKDDIKTPFAKYLDLTSVPRFVLFNKEAKIIEFNGTTVSNNTAFKSMLDKMVKKEE